MAENLGLSALRKSAPNVLDAETTTQRHRITPRREGDVGRILLVLGSIPNGAATPV